MRVLSYASLTATPRQEEEVGRGTMRILEEKNALM